MCLYPRLHRNPKYKPNAKNRGVIPPIIDERVLYVPIGCKKCIECKKQKAGEWRVRLLEDIKRNINAHFMTLTFSNDSYNEIAKDAHRVVMDGEGKKYKIEVKGYELDNWVVTKAVRLFTERWRKEYGKTIRHWLITEIGSKGQENIHIHGVMWTDKPKEINRIWKYGFTWRGKYVNERTIEYIMKYVTKTDVIHKSYEPIILTSNGIGKGYEETYNAKLMKYKEGITQEAYIDNRGFKRALPKYYKNKIYTEEEKEKLWIEKLDKEERYVMGTRIDISKGEEEYKAAVIQARKTSNRMGYGTGYKDGEAIEYEQQLRAMKQGKRVGLNNTGFTLVSSRGAKDTAPIRSRNSQQPEK